LPQWIFRGLRGFSVSAFRGGRKGPTRAGGLSLSPSGRAEQVHTVYNVATFRSIIRATSAMEEVAQT